MIRYKFSLVGEKGLKVSNASVWATIQKYKRHGTIFRLPGSVRLTLLRIVRELRNSHLSFGNVCLRINDYILRKLSVTVNR